MNILCCVYVCVCESVFSCVVLYGFQSNDKLLRGPNPCIPPHTHTHTPPNTNISCRYVFLLECLDFFTLLLISMFWFNKPYLHIYV